MIDAWLDLFLGSTCSACGRPGRALCPECRLALPTSAAPAWPTPTPPGLLPPWSTGEYADALRSLVVDHKERGRLTLARPLGRLLAVAVAAAWSSQHPARCPVRAQLVPVPSHPAVVRRRGQDPLLRITLRAAGELRRRGGTVAVRPALCVVARPGDQAGLDAAERARNVAGRFAVRRAVLRHPDGSTSGQHRLPVVLVDDVITTGATLREAQRALEAAGLRPLAAATVAATRRRLPEPPPDAGARLSIQPAGG